MSEELNAEKSKIFVEMKTMDAGSDGYKNRLNNLSLIQKIEHEDRELEMKEEELRLKQQELEIQSKEPAWWEKALDAVKGIAPAVVTGIFSLVAIRHITKNEKDEGVYYGSKGMGFIKKP